ncbi:MAG: hypothetical protein AAF423_10260 [Pseudomonadota bacterium]
MLNFFRIFLVGVAAAGIAATTPALAGSYKSKHGKSAFSQKFKSKGHKSRSFSRNVVRPRNTIRSLRGGRGIGFNGGFDFRGGV